MELVPLTDLASAIRGTAHSLPAGSATQRVRTDSRSVEAGDLFWALPGTKHDGHDFVDDARRRGAVACVVRRDRATAVAGSTVAVDDTLTALGEFAHWYRSQREALVIGVTGSVGKTTTREMIHSVLSARHAGVRSRQNFNNEIGLPLSLLDLGQNDEFGVFEMGAARLGDIDKLCQIASPEVGVLTRIGPAHLATFGSLENIYRTKGELLEALPARGFAVVCGDDEPMRSLAGRATCNVIFAGERPDNHVAATDVEFRPGHLKFCVDRQHYELAAPARHYLTAALCALAVGREIGIDSAAIAEGFRAFRGAPGRCHVEQTGAWTLIDDTYNASPLSMQAACACLRDWPASGRRLLVTGDMLELGDASPKCHTELGECVATTQIDRLLALGEQADQVAWGAMRAGMRRHNVAGCRDIDALCAVLDCWLEPGDVVLVKGSRGMHMERVVKWIKEHASAQPAGHSSRGPGREVA